MKRLMMRKIEFFLPVGLLLTIPLIIKNVFMKIDPATSSTRGLFLFLGLLTIVPSILFVRLSPRLVLVIVIGIAAANTSVAGSARLTNGPFWAQVMQGLVAALAVGSLLVQLLSGRETTIVARWKRAHPVTRLVLSALLIMLGIATVNTLLSGDPAAGTAIFFLIWPLVLSAGFESRTKPRALSPSFMFKCTVGAGLTLLATRTFTGSLGHIELILGVLPLSLLGLALGTGFEGFRRFVLIIGVLLSWFVFRQVRPDSQSMLPGSLIGAGWMVLAKMRSQSRPRLSQRVVTSLVVASILIVPLLTILMFYGRGIGPVYAVTNVVLDALGESEFNLLDRPARWEALFQDIMREPFRLRFTTFLDTSYRVYGDVWKPAFPHNILITMGRHIGVPGMIVMLVAIVILIHAAGSSVVQTAGNRQFSNVLTSFGILICLLWRNMWSKKLFMEPLEIVFFSLAVLTCLQVDRAKRSENDEHALPSST